MLEKFNNITKDELRDLLDAIPLITLLIASSDGKIDTKETDWGKKIARIRSYNYDAELKAYYMQVGKDFTERINFFSSELPKDVNERTEAISNKLAHLNPILAKIDEDLALDLYTSFRSFAKHVAKATGGFLGFAKMGPKESALVELNMIHPVEF
jgi:hypothetical protein